MPTIMLRGLPGELVGRIKAFGQRKGLKLPEAVVALVEKGLDSDDARSAGGKARAANLSPEARTEQARLAVQARWNKPPDPE